jgi:hypothetical protein
MDVAKFGHVPRIKTSLDLRSNISRQGEDDYNQKNQT